MGPGLPQGSECQHETGFPRVDDGADGRDTREWGVAAWGPLTGSRDPSPGIPPFWRGATPQVLPGIQRNTRRRLDQTLNKMIEVASVGVQVTGKAGFSAGPHALRPHQEFMRRAGVVALAACFLIPLVPTAAAAQSPMLLASSVSGSAWTDLDEVKVRSSSGDAFATTGANSARLEIRAFQAPPTNAGPITGVTLNIEQDQPNHHSDSGQSDGYKFSDCGGYRAPANGNIPDATLAKSVLTVSLEKCNLDTVAKLAAFTVAIETKKTGKSIEGPWRIYAVWLSFTDATPPVISSHADVSAEATNASGVVVTYVPPAVTDNVDEEASATCTPASGSLFPTGTTRVTCTAQDAAGNEATPTTFQVIVTGGDLSGPVVTVPDDAVVETTGPSGASYSFTASAFDDEDGALTPTCNPASGSTFPMGATQVTCSATDAAGNTGSAAFTVTVGDTTAPIIASHPDETAEATAPHGASVSYANPAWTDNGGDAGTASCSPPSGSMFPLGVNTVACQATDEAGNIGTSSFQVTVSDTTAPTLGLPKDAVLEATGASGAIHGFTATGLDLVDGAITALCQPASGSTFPLGITSVACTATDAHGNSASGSFTLQVRDASPPTLAVPSPILAEATSAAGASVGFSVSAADLVDGLVTPTCSIESGSTFAIGTTTVTCDATDGAGNSASASFTVSVQDTTAPLVDVPADTAQEAAGPSGVQVSYTATASDLVDGILAATCVPPSGSVFPLGTTEVVCTATDAHGNAAEGGFTVVVADTQAPVLLVPFGVSAEATGPQGAIVDYATDATDLVDGPVEPFCSPASGSLFGLGETPVGCAASDASGNAALAEFPVAVVDTTAPTLVVGAVLPAEATGPAGAVVVFSASASDLVEGDVTVECTRPSGGTFPLGFTTVTCSATDANGNHASVEFQVLVRDTAGPSMKVPSSMVVEADGPEGTIVEYSASSEDAVDGPRTASCAPPSGHRFPLGTTTVECRSVDESGNEASATFQVMVRDTTPPVVEVPADLEIEALGPAGNPILYEAAARDSVDGDVGVECQPASGSSFPLGQTQVSCMALDGAGNRGVGTFVVHLVDTTKPLLVLPEDIVVEAGSPAGAPVSYSVGALDGIDGPVPVTCEPAPGALFAMGPNLVSCSATDGHGNTATGSFHVGIVDTTPPAIHVPADVVVEAEDANGKTIEFEASAVDAVDGALAAACAPGPGLVFSVGTTRVQCAATDSAGNTGRASFLVTVTDTTPPTVTAPEDRTLEAFGPYGAPAHFEASAHDAVDGDVQASCEPASGSTFPLGATRVECTATDTHGNHGQAGFHLTVVDTTAPILQVSAPHVQASSPLGEPVTFTVTATDLVDGAVAATCTPASGELFPIGSTRVECSAADTMGNTATMSFEVTVSTTLAPVLVVPESTVGEATGPEGGPIEFQVYAHDLVDGTVAPLCHPPSGSLFPMGVTIVTCTATDAQGNSATANFPVTVSDTTGPTVHVPDDVTTEATGPDGAVVHFKASASDSVEGDRPAECSPSSGAMFPLGATLVTCQASDAQGNTGSDGFYVTVVDSIAPQLVLPDTMVVHGGGLQGGPISYEASALDGVDGVVTPGCSPASGDAFPLGRTTVQCQAVDAHGNLAEGSFEVWLIGPPAALVFLGQVPSQVRSLEAFILQVAIVDPLGQLVAGAHNSVALFRTSGPLGGVIGGVRLREASQSTVTFDGLTLDKAGDYVITATSEGFAPASSPTIRAVPGEPRQLSFGPLATDVLNGGLVAVEVRVLDAAGNLVEAAHDEITLDLSQSPAGGRIDGTLALAAENGVASFDDVRLTGAGVYGFQASSGALVPADSTDVTVQPDASSLTFDEWAADPTSGKPFSLTVRVRDENGDVVPDASNTVTLSLTPSTDARPLNGATTRTAIGGVAVFSGLTLERVGTYRFLATSPGLASAVSAPAELGPGAPMRLSIDPLPRPIVTDQGFAVVARTLDAAGNLVSGAAPSVTLSKVSGPADGTLTGNLFANAVGGIATFRDVRLSAAGTYRLGVSSPGLAPASSPAFPANPTDSERLATIDLAPGDAIVPAGTGATFTVNGFDAAGEAIPGLAYTFRLVENPGLGLISPDGHFLGIRAGNGTLEARLGDVFARVPLAVTPGSPAQIVLTPETASVGSNETVDFTAIVRDSFGNPVGSTADVEWRVGDGGWVSAPPETPFIFAGSPTDGVFAVTARSGTIARQANVMVTSTRAPSAATTSVDAAVAATGTGDVVGTAYSAGVASAEADATIRIVPPPAGDLPASAGALLGGATINLERPAMNLAILVETRLGNMEAPPPEIDMADLASQLESLDRPVEPGIFVRISAVEGNTPLPSAALNDLLGASEFRVRVPLSYFVANSLDPLNTRMYEYSEGSLVRNDILPLLLSPEPDADGMLTFLAFVDQYSTFALIGLPLSTPIAAAQPASSGLYTSAGVGVSSYYSTPAARPNSATVSAAAPAGVMAPGNQVNVVEYVSIDGSGQESVSVVLPAASVPDPDRGLVLRYDQGSWLPASHIDLRPSGDAYTGTFVANCCGTFAVGFDTQPPTIRLPPPPSLARGTVSMAPEVSDNVQVARVDLFVDGVLAQSRTAQPFEFALDSLRYENGPHEIRMVATDYVGNQAESRAGMAFQNAPSEAGRPLALAIPFEDLDVRLDGLYLLALFGLLVVAGGAVSWVLAFRCARRARDAWAAARAAGRRPGLPHDHWLVAARRREVDRRFSARLRESQEEGGLRFVLPADTMPEGGVGE